MASSYTGKDGVELAFLRSPVDLYNRSHELFTAEALVYATALVGFLHARRYAKKADGEAMLFFAIAFAAASFVDPFCLISEQIRNYFHSHASILMWDRHVAPWQFPLFACIAYVPGALVWQLGLPLLAETGLVVFVSSWSFYCFDLFACRWLLYQWHVSDPLYQARTECVPLASSMWVMTYAGTASLLARLAYRWVKSQNQRPPEAFDYSWWALFGACTLAFLPLHILPISVFYFPPFFFKLGLEYHVVWGFGLLGLALAIFDTDKNFQPIKGCPHLALLQSIVWFGSLLYVLLKIEPYDVISTSVHQPYGGLNAAKSNLCKETEHYLFGLSERKKFVCDEDLTHWTIAKDPLTGELAQPKDEWYTIRGLPMDKGFYNHYAASLAFAVAIHLFLYFVALRAKGASKKSAKAKTN